MYFCEALNSVLGAKIIMRLATRTVEQGGGRAGINKIMKT